MDEKIAIEQEGNRDRLESGGLMMKERLCSKCQKAFPLAVLSKYGYCPLCDKQVKEDIWNATMKARMKKRIT